MPATSTLRRPLAEVSFGGGAEVWRQHLLEVTVELALAPVASRAEVVAAVPDSGSDGGGVAGGLAGAAAGALGLGGGGGASGGPPEAAPGDSGNLALGYRDSGAEVVLTGTVESVRRGLDGALRLTVVDGGAALARLRLDQSWEGHSTGDILRDLAGEAGVETGTLEAGVDLPFYAVDSRRPALAHVADLAARSGLLAGFDTDGALEAVSPPNGSPVAEFVYAEDVLRLEVREGAPSSGVTVVGEGAAGSQGREAWSWLVKDPAGVTTETGDAPRRQVPAPALRSGEAVRTAARARSDAAGRRVLTGRLWVPGAPTVRPGTLISITEAPRDALEGTFLVRRVLHRLARGRGFTSRIDFVAGEAAAGGLAGLVGGLL